MNALDHFAGLAMQMLVPQRLTPGKIENEDEYTLAQIHTAATENYKVAEIMLEERALRQKQLQDAGHENVGLYIPN